MIPDFQATMRPLLLHLNDGEPHPIREAIAAVCSYFNLTPEEQQEMLPSQRQPTIHNRVYWAKTYLLKAGLLQSPARGSVRITDEGRKALASQEPINVAYLNRYPAFVRFHTGKGSGQTLAAPSPDTEQDPETILAEAGKKLDAALADDLMELLLRNPGRVYSRENLLNVVWGYEYIGDYRTVDVHVRRLREKLELDPASPEYIRTKWGVGYYLAKL